MDINIIKKLVRIVDTSEITDLEVEENGFRVKTAKKITRAQNVVQPQIMANSAPPVPLAGKKESEPSAPPAGNLHEIRSRIVGIFYRAPAPDAYAYVN